MKIERLAIPELILVTPVRHGDARGHFAETYQAGRFIAAGIDLAFMQDNQSLSRDVGTIRGLHCQLAPFAQGKLVRCISGAIWDVAVDARLASPTYGKWAAVTLTAAAGNQLWIPPGFLHGFCTLTADTGVLYKVTAGYDRGSEQGVIWDDPDLAIPWPLPPGGAVLSDKDLVLPRWAATPALF